MKFDLHIGTPVYCKDKQCGKLVKVVVNPETQTVSNLIVQQGLLWRQERVIPVSAVAQATPNEITLNLYSDELNNCPTYRETEVRVPSQDVQTIPHTAGLGSQFGPTAYESTTTLTRKRLREGVAVDKQILGRKTEVENVNHTLGHVDHVVVDEQSGEITEIIIRRGAIPTYYVISMSLVQDIHEENILVSLSRDDLDTLPRYEPRSDDEILEELYGNLLLERTPAFHRIDPSISSGSVRLAGFVPSETAKRHAEELAHLVPGVIDVQNDLVVANAVANDVTAKDVTASAAGNGEEMKATTMPMGNTPGKNGENLSARLSAALAADTRTRDTVIEVIDDRGVVTLQGNVEDAGTRAAAEEIATGQPGVTSVVNELLITSRV